MMVCAALVAEDWPQFRGPTAQGHAKAANLPMEIGAGKNQAWKIGVPGSGWSSPVIVKGQIFLTSAVTTEVESSLNAMCFDAANGKLVWSQKVFDKAAKGRSHSKNSHASPTPIVDGDRLYVHFGPDGSACLDLAGKVIWRNNEFPYPPVHGNGGSPVIAGDNLIFSCDGANNPYVLALDKRTGKQAWRTPRSVSATKTFSFCTPLLADIDGQSQVILPGSDVVCAYNPKTGQEIWHSRYSGYSVVPRPVFGQGMIFISTGFDQAKTIALRAGGGKGDVTDTHVAWTLTKGAPHTPSMLLIGTELYMVSDAGIASCVDAKTGEVHWQERVGGNYSSSPLFAADRIYLLSEEGKVTVIAADKKFKVHSTGELGERTLASMSVADNALYVRTAKSLFKFQAAR